MAILFSTLFDDSTGVTVSAGVTITGGECQIVGNDHYFRMTNAITGATGQTLFWKFKYSSDSGTQYFRPALLLDNTTVDVAGHPAVFMDVTNGVDTPDTYNWTGGVQISASYPWVANTIYYIKMVVNSNGTVTWYINTTGYSNSFTTIGTSIVIASFNAVGASLRAASLLHTPNLGSETLTVYEFFFANSTGFTPPDPSNPVAGARSSSGIDIAWTDNGDATSETGFKVERSTTSGSGFSQIATVAQGTNFYADTGRTTGQVYYYRVRSYVTVGGVDYNSGYTSEASAKPLVNLLDANNGASVSGLTAVTPGADSAVLSTSGAIQSYKLSGTYSDGYNDLGYYRTTGQTGAANQVIYWQGKQKTATASLWLLKKSAAIAYDSGNPCGINLDTTGNKIQVRDGNSTQIDSGFTWVDNTWYDFRAIIISTGVVVFYYRVSDTPGALNPNSSPWYFLAQSTIANCGSYVGQTIYFATNTFTAVADAAKGQFTDEFYYYDASGIILDYSALTASTAWTSVTGGGTVTFSGTGCDIQKDIVTGGDTCGILRDTGDVLDIGHTLTIEFKTHTNTDNTTFFGIGNAHSFVYGTVRQFENLLYSSTKYLRFLEKGNTAANANFIDPAQDVWYTLKYVVNNDGTVSNYQKLATDPDASYSKMGDTTLGVLGSMIGKIGYYYVNASLANSDSVYRKFLWTNGVSVAPNIPTSLTATAVSTSEIDLTWNDNGTANDETGISIERSVTSGSGFSEIATVSVGTTTYEDSGLASSTIYYYRIRSYWTFQGVTYYSSYTAEASAVTDSPPVTESDADDMLVLGELS